MRSLSGGQNIDELLDDFPYLSREDVMGALEYAAWVVSAKEVMVGVVLLRMQRIVVDQDGEWLASAIMHNADEIEKGAILSIVTKKCRLRMLPL